MTFNILRSPLAFLKSMLPVPHEGVLDEYQAWWEEEGKLISEAIDRRRTPWLRMFDRLGNRVDEPLFPPEYWKALKKGYQTGAVWRVFEDRSLLPFYLLGYVTCYLATGWQSSRNTWRNNWRYTVPST